MSQPLRVRVDRSGTPAVTVPETHDVTGGFAVRIDNDGPQTHVHLRLDGALGEVATLGVTNSYLEADDAETVRVDVDRDALPVEGVLVASTGFGAEEATTEVSVAEPVDVSPEVADDLAETPTREPEPTLPPRTLALGGVATLAVLVVVAAVALTNAGAVLVAVLAALGALAAVAYLLV